MTVKYRIIPNMTEQDIERFWGKVEVGGVDECWYWKTKKEAMRRPMLKLGAEMYLASRIAYKLSRNADPGQLQVCHTCDHPRCCAPHHLFLGTYQDNADDRRSKGRYSRSYVDPWREHKRAERARRRIPRAIREKRIHGNARFTAEEVREIRRSYDARSVSKAASKRALAAKYQVPLTTIGGIVYRCTYRDIT